jgi:hypothetical protein
MPDDTLTATRRAWHAVGELVLAGPQHREHGTIRLRVVPGGFAQVTGPLRVEGAELVGDGARVPLRGPLRALGEAVGVAAGAPEGLYRDHADLGPDDEVAVDAAAAAELADWLARGDAGLRAFAPGVEPVLWPEHFDLAVTVDEVNYGISLGDAGHAAPYAYVGPWTARTGAFWNAPFGALRPAADLPDGGAVAAFFAQGRAAAS